MTPVFGGANPGPWGTPGGTALEALVKLDKFPALMWVRQYQPSRRWISDFFFFGKKIGGGTRNEGCENRGNIYLENVNFGWWSTLTWQFCVCDISGDDLRSWVTAAESPARSFTRSFLDPGQMNGFEPPKVMEVDGSDNLDFQKWGKIRFKVEKQFSGM